MIFRFLLLLVCIFNVNGVNLRILHLNDIYQIKKQHDLGGMAQIKYILDDNRRSCGHCITTFGGDMLPALIGPLPIPVHDMMPLLESLGIQIGTLGNHEFDIGPDRLRMVVSRSKIEWINSNVKRIGNNHTFIDPCVIRDYNGTKVAFIGLLTQNTFSSNHHLVKHLFIEDPIITARRIVNDLKSHVDVFIALTHQDLSDDIDLADDVPELHLILGAHDHESITMVKQNTLIIKSGKNAEYLGIVDLEIDVKRKLVFPTWELISTYKSKEDLAMLSQINTIMKK